MGCGELVSRSGTFSKAERESNKELPREPTSRAAGLVQRFATLLGTSTGGIGLSFDKSEPRAIFRALDEDGSGELDGDEFERACVALGLGWSRPMMRGNLLPPRSPFMAESPVILVCSCSPVAEALSSQLY